MFILKNFAFVLVQVFLVSCATENNQETVNRELAKKDAIEKFKFPEGSKFSYESINVIESDVADGSVEMSYLVKITAKPQNRKINKSLKLII